MILPLRPARVPPLALYLDKGAVRTKSAGDRSGAVVLASKSTPSFCPDDTRSSPGALALMKSPTNP